MRPCLFSFELPGKHISLRGLTEVWHPPSHTLGYPTAKYIPSARVVVNRFSTYNVLWITWTHLWKYNKITKRKNSIFKSIPGWNMTFDIMRHPNREWKQFTIFNTRIKILLLQKFDSVDGENGRQLNGKAMAVNNTNIWHNEVNYLSRITTVWMEYWSCKLFAPNYIIAQIQTPLSNKPFGYISETKRYGPQFCHRISSMKFTKRVQCLNDICCGSGR